MTVKEEKQKQKEVEEDPKTCKHIGYFVGFGFKTIQLINGEMLCVHAIVCMMCGAIFNPTSVIKGIKAFPDNLMNLPKNPFSKS